MKRHSSLSVVAIFAVVNFSTAAVTEQKFSLLFANNSFELEPFAKEQLAEAVEVIRSQHSANYEIHLDAHTDNVGSVAYNIDLSQQRAQSVFEFLTNAGLEENKIMYQWYGETKPIAKNESEIDKQANRRVELTLKIFHWNSVQELISDLSNKPFTKELTANVANKVKTQSGFELNIPANAFETEDGKPILAAKVTINVVEALDKESWLRHGLSTISNQGILVSGGMFKIDATIGSQKLRLKDGITMNAAIPAEKLQEGMSLYIMNENSSTNIKGEWVNTQRPVLSKINGKELPFVKIDTNKLNEIIEMKRSKKYTMLAIDTLKLSLIPAFPKLKVAKPRKPKVPLKEEMKPVISNVRFALMTKSQRNKLMEKEYEKRMRVYHFDSMNYEKRLKRFYQAVETYQNALRDFELNRKLYERIAYNEKTKFENNKDTYFEFVKLSECIKKINEMKKVVANQYFTSSDQLRQLTASNYNTKRVIHPLTISRFNSQMKLVNDAMKQLGCTFDTIVKMDIYKAMWHLQRFDKDIYNYVADLETDLYNQRSAAGLTDINELRNAYTAQLSSMGWINIDKLSKQTLTAKLQIDRTPESQVYLIFDNSNTVISYFGNEMMLPENENITVLGVNVIDGKPFYDIKKITTSKRPTKLNLEYKEGSLKDVKDAIRRAV